MACLPILEQMAEQSGFIVSESVREDDFVTDKFDNEEVKDGL
jgi:hypothetical protein